MAPPTPESRCSGTALSLRLQMRVQAMLVKARKCSAVRSYRRWRRRQSASQDMVCSMTRGIRAWLSCRFASQTPMDRGRPVRSVIKWIFDPHLPRSTGFGPVSSPFFKARMFTESIAQRDQSNSPREPPRDAMGSARCCAGGAVHCEALRHCINRRPETTSVPAVCRDAHSEAVVSPIVTVEFPLVGRELRAARVRWGVVFLLDRV
jgi:hypothetical protein